eukprot:gene20484-28104_t
MSSTKNDQAYRAISTSKLHASRHFHTWPINVVVYHGSQRDLVLSYPAARLAPRQVHQRYVHPGPLVLGTDPLKLRTPTADRDQTVSRRSEPSSRTTLIGEQPNPWD